MPEAWSAALAIVGPAGAAVHVSPAYDWERTRRPAGKLEDRLLSALFQHVVLMLPASQILCQQPSALVRFTAM